MNDIKYVSVSFFTRLDIRSEIFAKQFFEVLQEHAGVLVPDEFDVGAVTGHRWAPFDPAAPDWVVQAWRRSGSVLMRRKDPMESEITVDMHFAASGMFNRGSILVDERHFESPDETARFLDLTLALYALLYPAYGLIHSLEDKLETRTVMHPKYGKTVMPTNLKKGLPGIYWANYLGPEYVAMLGTGRLLSAPYYDLQELPDGGMLILTSRSPLEPSSKRSRDAQQRLRRYLGEDIFYPSSAASTRVPVFRFDVPSLHVSRKPLTDSQSGTVKRQAEAQNLIDNAADFASLLSDELAEEGVNLDYSVDSLRALDQALLQKREAGERPDGFSLKMVAAYVGEVAKRSLQGQWVVDEMTGEPAIQLKGARIFPLSRVTKFFSSEELEPFSVLFEIADVIART
jgi:hypothetical protein